ncbi:MAG: nicotinate phosphoribosyltransferase [Dehalococcoidia bacterium]
MPNASLSDALFADLYELTMAQAYWQHGRAGSTATFSLFFRTYPPDRGYVVFAGLEDALDYLQRVRFTDADIAYLRSLGLFDDAFLDDYLRGFRFTGSVRAMTEGDPCFVNEPVMEVSGPIIEAQLVETYLMNQVNLQTLLATKAARVVHAARGKRVVEFAARRTQGTDASMKLARVSYLVGAAGTSNVMAAGRYGIPPAGTMAHSFITSFPSELEAFRAYAESFPDTSTLLVDTYDTVSGTKHAVEVAQEMRRQGHELRALRLDSGDLLALSFECRSLLDDAGLQDVQLFASGGLDEYDIEELVAQNAPFDGFGVGTKLGVSADAPYIDWAYKLVECDGQPVLKLSTGKATLAGRKQVYRRSAADGSYAGDIVALASEPVPGPATQPLLHEVMRAGERTAPSPSPSLAELRERFAQEIERLPEQHRRLRAPDPYGVAQTPELEAVQRRVTQMVTEKELGE